MLKAKTVVGLSGCLFAILVFGAGIAGTGAMLIYGIAGVIDEIQSPPPIDGWSMAWSIAMIVLCEVPIGLAWLVSLIVGGISTSIALDD